MSNDIAFTHSVRIVGYSYKAGGSDVCALYEWRGTRPRLPESATAT